MRWSKFPFLLLCTCGRLLVACGSQGSDCATPAPDPGGADVAAAVEARGGPNPGSDPRPPADPGAPSDPGPSGDVGPVADAAATADAGTAAGPGASGGGVGSCSVDTLELSCDPGPATRCTVVEVRCDGLEPIQAQLRITDPAGAVSGTVVVGSGGGGTKFYGEGKVAPLIQHLHTAGYRIVDRRWSFPWMRADDAGLASAARRYAALLSWIHGHLHDQGGFCVTGNSGGSAEIGYALAHHGAETLIDLAVPTSGPPMGRVDYGCLGAPEWPALCATLSEGSDMTPSCSYVDSARNTIDQAYAGTPCTDHDESARARLHADSVLAPDADLDYPNTVVTFVFGARDATEAVPLGRTYQEAIQSQVSYRFVPGTGHLAPGTTAGQKAIYDAIVADCHPHP